MTPRVGYLGALMLVLLLGACIPKPESPQELEVMIATKPDGASVLVNGADLGVTPFVLTVKEETNVILQREGHVVQAVMVSPNGPPHVLVDLIAEPTPIPAPTPAPTAKPKPTYNNVRTAKEAYRAGRIDRTQYDQIVRRLKTIYNEEIDRLKKAYRAGQISRDRYEQRVRAAKARYEG